MIKAGTEEAEAVLDQFAEAMFRLMIEHHQRQALELDLTMSQAQALKVLRGGPLCAARLAVELNISAPAVTQLTNRLSRKRLIERRTVDGDRRAVQVSLTERGLAAIDSFRERRNTIFCGALDRLSHEDRSSIVWALSKMIVALEEYNQGPRDGNSASGLQKIIVYREHEAQPAPHGGDLRTAVEPLSASNSSSRPKTGQGGRRVKMEWD